MTKKIIHDYLETLGVEESEKKADVLERYADEIMLFNPKLKLVGSTSRDDIVIRHILDSASAYNIFKTMTEEGDTIADLGSGAGLPGIVLSVLLPERKFFLIERMQRRVGFLRSVSALLGLENVKVIDRDMSQLDTKFSLLTSRAFHPVYDIASSIVKLSSAAVFYKGVRKNIEKEVETMREHGYSADIRIEPLTVPKLDEERNALILTSWRRNDEKR